MAENTLCNPPSFYINLPTAEPEAAAAFFVALGFDPLKLYSDEKSKAFRLPAPNDSTALMLSANDRFRDWIRPDTAIANAHKSTEVIFCIAVPAREDVDAWLAKVEKAGGTKDPFTLDKFGEGYGMYTRSFADLDGHIWELCSMLGGCGSTDKTGQS